MAERMWLDDTDVDEYADRPRRRPGRMFAMAAIPWVVVAALVLLPARLGHGDAAPPTGHVTLTHADTHAEDADVEDADVEDADGSSGTAVTDGTVADPAAGLWVEELRGGWRLTAGSEEIAALGVVVARAWLTGIDPVVEVIGLGHASDGGYAEHLVVEAVEQPAPEAAVVTLLTVLLDAGPTGYEAAVRRLAVPIAIEADGPRPAGTPWWLPGPSLEPLLPALEPIDDEPDHLAALDALAVAGWPDAELLALSRTSGWPIVVEAAVTHPDGTGEAIEVWLRRHLGGFVVAGTTLDASGPRTPTAGPHADADPPTATTPPSQQQEAP